VEWHGRLAVVAMPEEIDMSNGAEVQQSLLSALGQRPTALIVDMTSTTFCDSAGVRAVMLTGRQAVTAGCELRLVVGSPGVMRVFSVIGADQVVEVHRDLASALEPASEGQHHGDGPSPADGG
jgi:anti-sigma B factor antagonist